MTRRALLLALFAVLFAVLHVPASAQERSVETESLKVGIDAEWAGQAAPGYVPVRLDITNLGDARVLELVGQGSRSSRTGRSMLTGSTTITQTIRLARGARVRLTVPVPVFGDSETLQFDIRERGRLIEQLTYMGVRSHVLPQHAPVLVVSQSDRLLARVARRRTGTSGSTMYTLGRGGATVRTAGGVTDVVLEPDRLPANWLGFTSLRAVVIDPPGWEQLSDVQKSALVSWIAAGGDLLFVDGDPNVLFPEMARTPPEAPVRIHFFGRVYRVSLNSLQTAGIEPALLAVEKLRDARWALPANGAPDWGVIAGRGFRLTIPGIEGVPARTYLAILILFGVLIGPVNYWWLRRRRQQVLIVLTVPVISAVFIVLLAGYALAGEGFGVHARAVSLTLLDQASRQSVTRTAASVYAAGLTPSGGLRFPKDVAVFPLGFDGSGVWGRLRLDLTDAQRFSAGLVEARSATNLEMIGVRTARERLSFSRESGSTSVVNGLDATVTSLVYDDGSARYVLAAPLPPGAKAILTTEAPSSIRVPSDAPMAAKFLHLVANQPAGSYLAVLDRSPFWEAGVTRFRERGSFHLLLGWPEPPSPQGAGGQGAR